MATTPQFVSVPNVVGTTFVNADGTTAKTLFTAGSNGSRVEVITLATDQLTAVPVILSIKKSGTAYKVQRIVIPPASTSLPLTTMALGDQDKHDTDAPLLITSIPSGVTIEAAPETAMTSSYTLTIVVFGGDF